MDSGKIVAIVTGAISIILALAYLVLVQILDFRGAMVPAPIETVSYNQIYTNLYIEIPHAFPRQG
jgi:hypothetical protein